MMDELIDALPVVWSVGSLVLFAWFGLAIFCGLVDRTHHKDRETTSIRVVSSRMEFLCYLFLSQTGTCSKLAGLVTFN